MAAAPTSAGEVSTTSTPCCRSCSTAAWRRSSISCAAVEANISSTLPGSRAASASSSGRDNLDCHQWAQNFKIPTSRLSAAEWQERFQTAGFRDVQDRRIPDLSPTPEVYAGRWFRDAAQMQRFKTEGALLVTGVKP